MVVLSLSDTAAEEPQCCRILQSFVVDDPSLADCRLLRAVCVQVTQRSTMLAAPIIAGILDRVKKPRVGIAVEGSMYKGFPTFRKWMTETVAKLCPDYKADSNFVEDGSGKGAVVTAAVVARLAKEGR